MTNAITSVSASVGESVPVEIASWLACLAIVLVIGLLIVKVAKEIRGKPMAGEVQMEAAERYVTKRYCEKEHDALKSTTRDLFSKVGGVERGAANALSMEVRTLRAERKEDAIVLQARLSKFEEQIGGLVTATHIQNGQLNRIDEKLDNLTRRKEKME
jgi:hypothetical protein